MNPSPASREGEGSPDGFTYQERKIRLLTIEGGKKKAFAVSSRQAGPKKESRHTQFYCQKNRKRRDDSQGPGEGGEKKDVGENLRVEGPKLYTHLRELLNLHFPAMEEGGGGNMQNGLLTMRRGEERIESSEEERKGFSSSLFGDGKKNGSTQKKKEKKICSGSSGRESQVSQGMGETDISIFIEKKKDSNGGEG